MDLKSNFIIKYAYANHSFSLPPALPDLVPMVVMGLIMIFTGFLAFILWKSTTDRLIRKNQKIFLEDIELLHGTDYLKAKMFEMQSFENAGIIFSRLIDIEMKMHDGVKNEVVCCMKVSLQKWTIKVCN